MVLKQIVRGCGYLPYVGRHPGTEFVVAIILIGTLAGARAGYLSAILGTVVTTLVFGSMYLYGAYDRANTSDRIQEKNVSPIHKEERDG